MSAGRWSVQLYQRGSRVGDRTDMNVDLDDDGRLREILEELVVKARGSLKLDLSQFRMEVQTAGGGMVRRAVSIDSAGRTMVKR